MGRTALLCIGLLALPCVAAAQDSLHISLAHGSATERMTQAQLQRLLRAYDTRAWHFTRTILIDDSVIPHSHPTLTLNKRHLKDDELLLSTFLHEQLHWHLVANPAATDSAIAELRQVFPDIPVGFPQGDLDATGNYAHLIVCYLEYRADRELLGELRAQQVISFWSRDHYTWIYRTVLERPRDIDRIVVKHRLVPGLGR